VTTPDFDSRLVSELARLFGNRLIRVESPLKSCAFDPHSADCEATLRNLRNPFFVEEEPGGFHTTGWLGAFDSRPSPYAVGAETAADLANAVVFARDHGLRVVVKGTGHDYLGRSGSADALLLWTRRLSEITVHDSFRPTGAGADVESGVPAVAVGAGVRWLEAYQRLAPLGRYVQGGGCTTVGAAGGFTQGGGFGSFSRRYGTAAGNLLEAEVVTASGEILVANDMQHADLFWALRGGGGGTFGIVSKMTMRTHTPPQTLGAVTGTIRANGDDEFRALIREIVHIAPRLCDEHWGEQITLNEDNSADFSLTAADLNDHDAQALWAPFLEWVAARPSSYTTDVFVATLPFDRFWDAQAWDELAPDMIRHDDRPGGSLDHFWWSANQGEVSEYLDAYQSRWLPLDLIERSPEVVVRALFEATRHWHFSLHFNKALGGASPEALIRDRATSINPVVFGAACLVMTGANQQDVFPGLVGREPDIETGTANAHRVRQAMEPIRALTPDSGSYVNETDFFEPDWQQSFWGVNYGRLLAVKETYDPTNFFCVHHGVGSEGRAS
jgi:FAD/FMN-containing dehydrogenase